MRPSLFSLVLMSFVLEIISPSRAADLVDAVGQLQSWQDKMVSIRVRSQMTSVAASDQLLREAGKQTSTLNQDWVWEDSGRYREQSTGFLDDGISGRGLRLGDIKLSYHIGYSAGNPGEEMPVRVDINVNSITFSESSLNNPPLQVVWDGKTRTWLGTRLATVIESKVTSDGCLEIDGAGVGTPHAQVVLDPQHGFLPKLTEYPDYGHGATRYTTDEFRELEPGFWFPWKGTNQLGSDSLYRWEVLQVDLNTELPDSLFVPPMGAETFVYDGLTGKGHWHGGKPPASLVAERDTAREAAAATPVAGNPNPLTGLPDRPGNWSMWLVVLGIVCVSGGVWIRRRG